MNEENMLISEIEPIIDKGINLLYADNPEQKIDNIIERPLREACKIFRRKGIETVMSSANKNNITKPGESPKEKEDIIIKDEFFYLLDERPSFEDAGVGYAWIMINFDTLSDENKDIFFKLEEIKGPNGEMRGEKAIWFVHPTKIKNLEMQLKLGEIDYDFLLSVTGKGERIPPRMEIDKRLVKFEEKAIILSYNNRYPESVVIIRMPVNAKTTVKDAEGYFCKIAEMVKEQQVELEIER